MLFERRAVGNTYGAARKAYIFSEAARLRFPWLSVTGHIILTIGRDIARVYAPSNGNRLLCGRTVRIREQTNEKTKIGTVNEVKKKKKNSAIRNDYFSTFGYQQSQ